MCLLFIKVITTINGDINVSIRVVDTIPHIPEQVGWQNLYLGLLKRWGKSRHRLKFP